MRDKFGKMDWACVLAIGLGKTELVRDYAGTYKRKGTEIGVRAVATGTDEKDWILKVK